MDVIALINKAKGYLLNIIIIILAVIIASNNYKAKVKNMDLLKDKLSTELKRNEVIQDISNLEKRFALLKNSINSKAISLIIDSLSNMAKSSDVKIVLIKPYNEKRQNIYTVFPFELVVYAKSYHEIGNFISMIENSPDIYIVGNIVMTSNPKEEEDKVITKLVLDTILIN